MDGDVFVNGAFKFLDGMKDAAADTRFGNVAEKAFDQVQPRTAGRGEVDVEFGIPT